MDPSPERRPWQSDGGGAVPDAGEDEGGPADLQRREGLPGKSGGDDDAADELKVAEQRHLAGRQVAQPVAPESVGRGRTRDPEIDERAQRATGVSVGAPVTTSSARANGARMRRP